MKHKLGVILSGLAIFAMIGSPALANTKPFFRISNGDTFVGGWFNNGNTACGAVNYQHPTSYSDLTLNKTGGVMAFDTDLRQGAGSDQAIFSLGLLEYKTLNTFGFHSGPSGRLTNTFANTIGTAVTDFGGGFLDGLSTGTRCIPDYFSTKQNSPVALPGTDVSNLNNGQYTVSGAMTTLTASAPFGAVAAKSKVTIFVTGDLYLSTPITFAASNESNVPKLTIIVKGNIFIDPNVDTLTGMYIAQPDYTTGVGGGFWTCHDNTASSPLDTWITTNCNKKALTVNGAVVAKQVLLLRTVGDLGGAPAETFNYIPELAVGGPIIYGSTNSQNFSIKSIISLPPVY